MIKKLIYRSECKEIIKLLFRWGIMVFYFCWVLIIGMIIFLVVYWIYNDGYVDIYGLKWKFWLNIFYIYVLYVLMYLLYYINYILY